MRSIPLAYKIVLALLAISIVPLIAMYMIGMREFEKEMLQQASSQVSKVASKKTGQIGTYVTEQLLRLHLLAISPKLATDFAQLDQGYTAGITSTRYQKVDAETRPYYREFISLGGYYDLFFINTQGDIVFTVAHESDFATNLHTGPYRDTELARIVQQASRDTTGVFSNVAYYPPSQKPAAFLAAPILRNGQPVGTLAAQLNQDRFEQIVMDRTGLGKTGQTRAGQAQGDQAVILFESEAAPFHLDAASSDPIQRALTNREGEGKYAGVSGEPMIGAWLHVPGTNFGIVAGIELAEALEPVAAMRVRMLLFELAVTLLVIVAGLFIARYMTRPLRELNSASQAIAAGDLSQNIKVHGNDEVASLGESFNQMVVAVRNSQHALEERVRERTQELEIANLSLVENERFVRTVLDTVLSGIITTNEHGIVQSINRAAIKMFGREAHEIVGENVNILMPQPYRDLHDDYIGRYLKTGERKVIGIVRELSGLRKDGSIFPIEIAVNEVAHEGKNRLFVGAITDITMRKAAEAINLRHTRVIEESPVMVAITDTESNVEYVNPAFSRITGYSFDEVLGKNIRFIKSGNTPDHVYAELFSRLNSGGAWNGELQNRRKDGSLFWASVTISPVHDEHGRLINYVAINKDITDQKMLEDEVRKHRDHLTELVEAQTANIKAIVDTAADGIVTIDHLGNVLSFNRAAEQMFGFTADEAIGNNVSLLMPSPHREAHNSYIERYLNTGIAHIIGSGREVAGQRKDGSTFPLYLAVSEIEIGGLKRFTGIMRDITAQKETEAALIRAREAAEAAARAKSNFLANMSHEIRTPMNAIIGMTDLVLDTPLQPQQEKMLRSVASSSKSLLNILNDILDLSKLESGKMELEVIPFSIREVLEGVEEVIKVSASSKGLEVIVNLDPRTPPCVIGDPTRLRQVLLNLAGNAVKFTEKGNITISARPTEQESEWHFSIEDTGIGIPEERQARVFERFSQADDSTTRRFGGTGLGTSISMEIVEYMQGRIWLESEAGKGSNFHFTARLPAAEGITDCTSARSSRSLGRSPRTRPLKILLAEDILLNQELAVTRLSQRRHQVVIAENGRIAVEKFLEEPFDLILMDVMMPEMDGEEATVAIRAIEKEKGNGSHIPIIMLTASVMKTDQRKYFDAGADGFVGKPIDFAELYSRIADFFPAIEEMDSAKDLSPEIKLPPVNGIDLQAGLNIWGNLENYRKALDGFMRDFANSATIIGQKFSAQQFDNAKLLTHTLKGVAGNIGATGLAAAAAELEKYAKRSSTDVAAPLAQFSAQMEAVIASIGKVEKIVPAFAATVTTDREQALPLLERLSRTLLRSELDEAAISQLRNVLDTQRFAQLESLIDAFEFSRATTLVNEIIIQLRQQGG